MKNNALYAELTDLKEAVTHVLQSPKITGVIESLPESVAAALRITKPKLPIEGVVELKKGKQVVDGRPNVKTPLSLLMKRKREFFCCKPVSVP